MKTKCKNCGGEFDARPADIKRGWGIFCSKRCKAIEQERRTGQHAEYKRRVSYAVSNDVFDTYDKNY